MLLLILEIWAIKFAHAQVQQGETCLFTCAYHISHACSIREYEYDFTLYTGVNQDYEEDGARATVAQLCGWIESEFPVVNEDLLTALDHHNVVITMVWVGDCYAHEIVIEGYTYTDIHDPTDIELIYYNPEYGKHEKMKMFDYAISHPLYAITIKK